MKHKNKCPGNNNKVTLKLRDIDAPKEREPAGRMEHVPPPSLSLQADERLFASTLALPRAQPSLALCQERLREVWAPRGCARSTYSALQLLLWLRGSVGRLESRTWIPSELIALIKIVTIASTGSFSRTITRQRLRSAALTWKEGFSVVAPISVIVPHST